MYFICKYGSTLVTRVFFATLVLSLAVNKKVKNLAVVIVFKGLK